jgi:Putative peptidoglycan binding domain
VGQVLSRRKKPDPAADDLEGATPDLAARDDRHPKAVELLQMKLNWHLGAQAQPLLALDGDYGGKTLRATQAFQKANGIDPNGIVKQDTWEALAKPPGARTKFMTGPDGRPAVAPDYEGMFEDGLLEITIAEGFDENEWLYIEELKEMAYGLMYVRGFTVAAGEEKEIYKTAGRPVPTGGTLYIKKDVGTSKGKPVHCVVNLITPAGKDTHGTTGGAETKAAAMRGMKQSDAFIYDGHGRYGTGPDFDRNWWFTVDWEAYYAKFKRRPKDRHGKLRTGTVEYQDSKDLHEVESNLNLSNPAVFEKLEKAGVITLHTAGEGNVGINAMPNDSSLHAYLQGRSRSTKGDEELRDEFKDSTERSYRLWLFNGCNTFNYEKKIRASGDNLSAAKLDMFATQNTIQGNTTAEALLSYVDGLINRESAYALEGRMEEAQVSEKAPYGAYGFEDNANGWVKP